MMMMMMMMADDRHIIRTTTTQAQQQQQHIHTCTELFSLLYNDDGYDDVCVVVVGTEFVIMCQFL